MLTVWKHIHFVIHTGSYSVLNKYQCNIILYSEVHASFKALVFIITFFIHILERIVHLQTRSTFEGKKVRRINV